MPEYDYKREVSVPDEDVAVKFDDCDFTWGFKVSQQSEKEKKADGKNKNKTSHKVQTEILTTNILNGIDINLKMKDFLVVVGQVGCGKTSLLYSIMEETILSKGKSSVVGSIAYVEQEPFIISDSVENNIRFGKPFNQKRLDDALKYSCLEGDVKLFGKGLKTVIGERGVNISGGQKARMSLARALYSDADIVLLDDPLSAVDPEVASKLFYDCF